MNTHPELISKIDSVIVSIRMGASDYDANKKIEALLHKAFEAGFTNGIAYGAEETGLFSDNCTEAWEKFEG